MQHDYSKKHIAGGEARLDGCSLMMNGLSTAAQMGAVKVSTIASFSGSRMTATRSAAAPQGQPASRPQERFSLCKQLLVRCLLQSRLTAQLGRAQFMMAPYPKMPRTASRPRLPQQLTVGKSLCTPSAR